MTSLSSMSINSTKVKQTSCPLCEDRGIRLVSLGDSPTFEPCPCMERRRLDRILKNSRITEEFQRLTFENFSLKGKTLAVAQILKQALNTAVGYVQDFEKNRHERCNGIALLGQPGVGKTHLSCAIANLLMAQGVSVLYFPHREGFSEMVASLGRKPDYFKINKESDCSQKIQAMKTVEVLIWDDLLKSKRVTDFEYNVICEVLNYRYMNYLPCVISSEYLTVDLLKFDQAIGRRIIEPAKGHLVEFSPNPTMIHGLM